MSSNINDVFTKEQLFAALEYDGIEVDTETINKAKNDDGNALWNIGFAYDFNKGNYPKALAWYRLSENQNYAPALINIGYLFRNGEGVPQVMITGLEYHLKAAGNRESIAISNIAFNFKNGNGITVNKYKALEWFYKSGRTPEKIEELNEEGFFLTKEDKNKTLYQLIRETEEIIREERMKRENTLKEENQKLKQSESSKEEEITNLHYKIENLEIKSQEEQQKNELLEQEKKQYINENQIMRQSNNSLEEQLKDKTEIVNSLKRENEVVQHSWSTTVEILRTLVELKNKEIDLLKDDKKQSHKKPYY